LLDDPAERARIGAEGQARAATFTWARTASAYADLYAEAARA
jgi:glycosyltransferase involved in cell wall biosynthesis